ncbi:helix-turn-helix domain-containing protein [Cupriavidus pinatubonensis]|uniref:helix-turn-helix transcriptional regulator n=1 Tax=Cupriavidus pinatubonensis TaxID=248026 RepID=UPI001CC3EA43|nr:helix-turn-helix transcriptional regulator [Cupriavidus pinatubonensis]
MHITTRQVLATLIRFALNKSDPTALAFLKKATIAGHLAISEATVYRALGALERAGLIERERQQRTRANLRVVGRIAFTGRLLQHIGMASQQFSAAMHHEIAPVESGLSSASLARVSGVNNPKQSSTKKHPGTGSFVRINNQAVPFDLAPLVQDQELKASGLFLLMRLARNGGHRLSDIVSVAGHALRPLRGRELFAYLKSLLERPIDFGHVARVQKAREEEERAATARAALEQQQVAQLVERYRGKRVSAPGGRIYEVDSASIVITETNGLRSSLGHARAHAWLIEMDRVAAKLSPVRAQPMPEAPRPSSAKARAAIEHLRQLVLRRPVPQFVWSA